MKKVKNMSNNIKRKIINRIFFDTAKKELNNSIKKAHRNIFKDDIFKGINKTTNP